MNGGGTKTNTQICLFLMPQWSRWPVILHNGPDDYWSRPGTRQWSPLVSPTGPISYGRFGLDLDLTSFGHQVIPSVQTTWLPRGSHVVTTWYVVPRGYHMVATWSLCGTCHVVYATWSPHSYIYMEKSMWSPHGGSVDFSTWIWPRVDHVVAT